MHPRNTLSFVLALLFGLPVAASFAQTSMGLHEAALLGNMEAVRQHIDAAADVNQKDAYGSTPLMIAATFDRAEVAKALIEAGADLTITNNDGATPLHAAAFLCRTEIVEALLAHGVNKYVRDNFGNTPLESVAAPFEKVESIYDVFAQGLGPLGLALDYDHLRTTRPRIVEMLRPRPEELLAVEYTPLRGDDWDVSTPSEQELDPMRVSELYLDASGLSTLYGLLVVKNGKLVAERYFNDGAVEQKAMLQSASKSYVSALVGIALENGCLSSLDQKMMEFFPEFANQISDPRKEQITIRHLLQMRSGYPWEETDPTLWDGLLSGDQLPLVVEFPLVNDPGTDFNYSNATTYWLGVIVARACNTDLKSFAQQHLFAPIGVEVGEWWQDKYGYYFPVVHFTARDAARFGLLYLDDGLSGGKRIVSAEWVRESMRPYSDNAFERKGLTLRDIGYGYQWWSAGAGDHRFDFAWGHGGQLIVLLDELDMVIVTTADPFFLLHDGESWTHEREIINAVGRFINTLPKARGDGP